MSKPDILTPPDERRRDAAATRLADYIKATVDAAPPLTAEQRERLAALLRPFPAAGGAQ
jgi:hypothetical protein